jgi:formylglycine-generating enzyme required for sulfatase activity
MMRFLAAVALAIWSLSLAIQPAFAGKRVALVIGNSAYQRVPVLANPAKDADDMSEMFRKAGFTVVLAKHNLGATEMRRALRDFSDEVRDADVAIVYYAGHGMEIEGTNYLIPVDALLERDIDAFDEAIPLDRLLTVIEPAKQLRLVILDACRDNPFNKVMKHSVAARAVVRGLAKVEPNSPNTMVAFAAKAGSTASDGDDQNSPYTTALLRHLPRPGLDLRKAFGFVRDDVLKATRNRQEPFIYGSLGGEDVALVPAPPPQAVLADPSMTARDDYDLAQQINVVSAWNAYIGKYPTGFYTDLAKAQRDKLMAAKAALAEEARLVAEKKALDDTKVTQKVTEADRAKAAAQLKAAEDARIAADKARLTEDAKAAEAARAKAAAQLKAAEDARIAADKARTAEEAKVAEATRAKAAAQLKATEDARIAAEKTRVVEQTKAAEAARAKAQPGPERLAAAVIGNPLPGTAQKNDEPLKSQGCPGAQVAALSSQAARSLSQPEECGLKPKDVFKECANCPEMVVVPAGEVLMGSNARDIDSGLAAANEGPQHKAVIAQTIAVGRFEVTREQYAAFVKSSGYKPGDRCFTFEQNQPREREQRSFLDPGFVQDGSHPAVCVSWTDAKAYVQWLSQTTGKPYRLLSETEFEYAARADSRSRFGASDDAAGLCKFVNGADRTAKAAGLPADAAYMDCSDGYPFTAPVGSFAANAFGLYDMIGNVWEWTEDCFADDYATASPNGAARAEAGCTTRTVRGGDWFSTETSLRPAIRAKANASARHDDIGFRVARTLGP